MKKLIVMLVSAIGLNAMAQNTPTQLHVLAVNGLNMRSQPDGNARVLTKVPFGKQVEVLERTEVVLQLGWVKDHWYKVRFRGREGYLFGGYLSELPGATIAETTTLAELLPSYCTAVLNQKEEATFATETTRTGDTIFYSILTFNEGVELELEQQEERNVSKLLLPLSVQKSYVLLESLLKLSGNAEVLDQLRFVKGKDGQLSRISSADGSVTVKIVSDEVSELRLTSFAPVN